MIIFKKNGIFHDNNVNPEHEDYVYKQIDSIIPYLTNNINFDNDLTLKDFLILLEPDEKMVEIVFGSDLGHFPISPYIDEVKKDYSFNDKTKLEYIECSWAAEQFNCHLFYENNKEDEYELGDIILSELDIEDLDCKDENDITIHIDVSAWGPYISDKNEIISDDFIPPTHMSFAIEFTSLSKLAHLPIKLNKNIEIGDKNEILSMAMDRDKKPIIKGVMDFTVFEAVGAILSEISFCGLPKDRDKTLKNIIETYDETKKK